MTVGGMRHYITYRAMFTGDQQHTCQAASGGMRCGAPWIGDSRKSRNGGAEAFERAEPARCDGGTWRGVNCC